MRDLLALVKLFDDWANEYLVERRHERIKSNMLLTSEPLGDEAEEENVENSPDDEEDLDDEARQKRHERRQRIDNLETLKEEAENGALERMAKSKGIDVKKL